MCIKKSYASRIDAVTAIVRRYDKYPDFMLELDCYTCPKCSQWHHTRRKQEKTLAYARKNK